ncbi:MAG: zinc-binding dehydrogenase [Planctomycetaceae bacterium]|nr:zinc-binding dehydrogenase [Planctomycetaceae bacterium]
MNTYQRYRSVDYRLPETYLSWELYGAGLENLGVNGEAVRLPLWEPTADEVLLRVDALGLCFSDTKLIWAGPNHPRITGRDLKNNPTVAGHEAAMTVVRVGSNWKNRFEIGQRFIIQADIKVDGEQVAFGYVQRGAMAQYAYVGPWVLENDGVSYLLPIKDSTGYAEAALVEPWACVEAAYHLPERTAPVAHGRVLVVAATPDAAADFTGVLTETPYEMYHAGGGAIIGLPGPVVTLGETGVRGVAAAQEKGDCFDDIFLVGVPDAELVEACDQALAVGGVLSFISGHDIPVKAAIDIGRAHYELTRYIGGADPATVYGQNTRTDLKPAGRAWMVGAAGPMGQMHVQRALEHQEPPIVLFCTDLSAERLAYMENRLRPLAERNGVTLVCLNVGQEKDLPGRIRDATGGHGFDDIYVHAPVPKLVEEAADHLADGSVLNVFAGVGIGTKANLSPEIFRRLHTRLIGSSGSSMEDIVNTLRKLESGRLATRMSLAAVGGIEATWLGIKGVKENRFPGKTVIFPQVNDLPLTGMDHFQDVCAAAAPLLEPGNVWTTAAEEAFLDNALELD